MRVPSIPEYVGGLRKALDAIDEKALDLLAGSILRAGENGSVVYVFGNGDSATNATHFACDLGKGTIYPGRKRLRVVSLNENVPLMTAWSNDESYESVFRQQLEGLLRPEDVVIGISTSGNSPNVVKAIEYANSVGAETFALSAFQGGRLASVAKHSIIAGTDNVEIAEDIHFILGHLLKIRILGMLAGGKAEGES